ncbi:MAG: biosynthetic arginine decarboxylase [Gemmatimonadota bacterium]
MAVGPALGWGEGPSSVEKWPDEGLAARGWGAAGAAAVGPHGTGLHHPPGRPCGPGDLRRLFWSGSARPPTIIHLVPTLTAMTPSASSAWSPEDSARLYRLAEWGSGYFSVSDAGTVLVRPDREPSRSLDLLEVVEGLKARDLGTPVVVRFPGVLAHRMRELRHGFDRAIENGNYEGKYCCAYPVKVNQQRHLCEEIVEMGETLGFGLEAGSKPELLAGLSLTRGHDGMPFLCNGFKDAEYVETVVLAAKMGRNIIPVVEQTHELELLIRSARAHNVTPRFGLRAKLASGGIGRWADSVGFRGKFGLSVSQVLASVDWLEEEGLLDGLRLLHCHIGSQIFDIRTIKYAVSEVARIYVELVRLGAPMGMLDLGGGLGIDYDGSQSPTASSVNYTLEQYAEDVIYRVKGVCDDAGVPHPDIITESGRALVAHAGVLVFQVLGSRVFPEEPDNSLVKRALEEGPEEETPQPLLDLVDAYERLAEGEPVEVYHDAEHALGEAMSLFNLGYMTITARAASEDLFWAIANAVLRSRQGDDLPEELADLPDRLGDIYFSNFSLFQSLIDSWGVDQVFPIIPIQRLDERPTRRAILADITCDSDGRVDRFPGEGEPKRTLELHALRRGSNDGGPAGEWEPYYLGVFLTGAYQETLGDLHNLFGDTHAVHISLDPDGIWQVEEIVEGDSVRDVLGFVQYDVDAMRRTLRQEIEASLAAKRLTLEEGMSMRRFLEQGIEGYTYLE